MTARTWTDHKRSGAEELRLMVRNFDRCRESFLDAFSLEQLVTIHRAWLASAWDFFPDSWTERQVTEALQGIPPQWDVETEAPVYATGGAS
jgi:hypothetical protein